ncbi:hypothetical protein [Paraburkholderia sp.]
MSFGLYWVLFFIALLVFAAIGFGLSALFPEQRIMRGSPVEHSDKHH